MDTDRRRFLAAAVGLMLAPALPVPEEYTTTTSVYSTTTLMPTGQESKWCGICHWTWDSEHKYWVRLECDCEQRDYGQRDYYDHC